MDDKRVQSAPVMEGLKDFQKKTVEYVFQRLYGKDGTPRFLVADEVGLGKTLVARGIIAKTIEYLQDTVERIDIIYICSNATIAKQNMNRLKVVETTNNTFATRLTYLPVQVKDLKKNKINFISFTPATTFDHTRSRSGHADERIILYHALVSLLLEHKENKKKMPNGLRNLFQATSLNREHWLRQINEFSVNDLDADLSLSFQNAVLANEKLYEDLKKGCICFADHRKRHHTQEEKELRNDVIGRLRSTLAMVCLNELRPNLIILDEFQRFKNLLSGDDAASMLARDLFEHHDARVLLLSATPYKMFTLDAEADQDDHYSDFIKTLNFLFENKQQIDHIKSLLSGYQQQLLSDIPDHVHLLNKKILLEKMLLSVMCRTERVSSAWDRNFMIKGREEELTPQYKDIRHAAMIDSIAQSIGAGETIEYWKSAPYLVNFLRNYDFRKKLDPELTSPSEKLSKLLDSNSDHILTRDQFDRYRWIDPSNPAMRLLFRETLEKKMWQLLWIPPSLVYIKPGGLFRDKNNVTKSLIFSSWNAVPDAIASLCSYEAERKMMGIEDGGEDVLRDEVYNKNNPLLIFSSSSVNDRLTGMPVVAWMLPSPVLAKAIDPLVIALHNGGAPLSTEEMRVTVKNICRELINKLPDFKITSETPNGYDRRWYWAAPILLEQNANLTKWVKAEDGWRNIDKAETDSLFTEHLEYLVKVIDGGISLGQKPEDLIDVLCDMALAGPGTCALRALYRIAGNMDIYDFSLLSGAARIASGFRSLFNMPESVALIRSKEDGVYWRLTLQYGIDGNLQALLDEYVHTLRESQGLQNRPEQEQVEGIATHIQSVLSLRTAQIKIDGLKNTERQKSALNHGKYVIEGFNSRCRFALRFGDITDDNNQALVRADTVRDAFNSPFRPFILASTSIGQEGLDFHTWCHGVMHWNLPSNPVDLEQREGRVHRYKGHAIRKNIAEKYGLKALVGNYQQGDPWQMLFERAVRDRPAGQNDLYPYWVFDGSAKIERHIPLLPFSKEKGKLRGLMKGLALYRLVFGQPRQEDLVNSLSRKDIAESDSYKQYFISLAPPISSQQ